MSGRASGRCTHQYWLTPLPGAAQRQARVGPIATPIVSYLDHGQSLSVVPHLALTVFQVKRYLDHCGEAWKSADVRRTLLAWLVHRHSSVHDANLRMPHARRHHEVTVVPTRVY